MDNAKMKETLSYPALRVRQSSKRTLYCFAADGREILRFAAVSRLHRADLVTLAGYQRHEVLAHIQEIQRYVESEDPMIPNAVVLALSPAIEFQPLTGTDNSTSVAGTLKIPLKLADGEMSAWVVDGQQRLAAVRDANIERFPLCVVGFIGDSVEEQRSQFILVNSTKPLPRGLIHELLPGTEAMLPTLLEKKRFPSYLLTRLNTDVDSPLQGLIRTPTNGAGLIRDNSILRMLEASISDGVLYRFRNPETGLGDADLMLAILKRYWGAVRQIFEDAWAKPPRRSRLMHGAGVVSLGYLMDEICASLGTSIPSVGSFAYELETVRPYCSWTEGWWDFGYGIRRRWDEVQNTSRDVKLLSDYLIEAYRGSRRKKVIGRGDRDVLVDEDNEANGQSWERFVPKP